MSKKRLRIGLLSDYLNSEYSENLITGISGYCRENEIELFLFPVGDFRKKIPTFNNFEYASVVAHINKHNLDGLLVTSGSLLHSRTKEEYKEILEEFRPLNIVNIASEIEGFHSVISDFTQAYEALIQYLIDAQGCKKFALMGVDSITPEVIQRTEIFNSVMEKNNIPLDSVTYWKSSFDYTTAFQELVYYKKENGNFDFDAIVALNDETAFACMDFCTKRLNLSIPNDIIITGFDNVQRATFSTPTLTSVNQQIEYIGYVAAQTCANLCKGKEEPFVKKVRAKTILRGSTAKNLEAQKSVQGSNIISVDNRSARDFTSSFSISEWYSKRNQIMDAAKFYSNLNSNISYDKIGFEIVTSLKSYGFQGAAVVAFDHPIEMPDPFNYFNLPKKARLVAGYDDEFMFNTNTLSEPLYFNPRESLIPPNKLKFPGCGTIVTALYRDYLQYGYLVLRCNNYDLGVYDLIQHSLSNLLSLSYEYTLLNEEKNKIFKQNKKLDYIAHNDELTGLNNRRGFMDFGQACLTLSESIEQTGLVVFCDMDGLKYINDTYGHENGDKAIIAQSEILNKSFRSGDILGRLGGDEFAVICPGLTEENFMRTRERIEDACKKWTLENQSEFELSISLGAVPFPYKECGYRMEALLAEADKRLYEEKKGKKNRRK